MKTDPMNGTDRFFIVPEKMRTKAQKEKDGLLEPHSIPGQIEGSDLSPCDDCGDIYFLRSGTCYVCQNCGSKQGCI